jgi:hypothetical protein
LFREVKNFGFSLEPPRSTSWANSGKILRSGRNDGEIFSAVSFQLFFRRFGTYSGPGIKWFSVTRTLVFKASIPPNRDPFPLPHAPAYHRIDEAHRNPFHEHLKNNWLFFSQGDWKR